MGLAASVLVFEVIQAHIVKASGITEVKLGTRYKDLKNKLINDTALIYQEGYIYKLSIPSDMVTTY